MEKIRKTNFRHIFSRILPSVLVALFIILMTIVSSETDLIDMNTAYIIMYLLFGVVILNFIYLIIETIYFYIKKEKTLFKLNCYLLGAIFLCGQLFS